MTPEELKRAAIELFGQKGWVAALALHLEIDRTQVWRYINAKTPVPGPVAAAVRCWTVHGAPGIKKDPPKRVQSRDFH